VAHTTDYARALAELRRARRIILTAHVKPDGDALGSLAAMRRWLKAEGKRVDVILPTPPPAKYLFMDADHSWKTAKRDVDLRQLAPPDLICILDTSTWLQLAGMEPLVADSHAPVLVIDHHRTQDPLSDFALAEPEAAATAEIVYRLLGEAGVAIDAEMATYLFVGLAMDTDWFRLPAVNGDLLRLEAALVDAGARPHDIHDKLYFNDDLTKVHLFGRAMETMRPALDGRVMVMRLARSLFRELGADIGDTENLINECMRVRGALVGVMLVEADGDDIRISLRSKPPVEVLSVAQRFGGGGHARAAGARLKGPIDRVEAEVLAAVAEILATDAPPA